MRIHGQDGGRKCAGRGWPERRVLGAGLDVLEQQLLGLLASIAVFLVVQAATLAAEAEHERRRRRKEACCLPRRALVHLHGDGCGRGRSLGNTRGQHATRPAGCAVINLGAGPSNNKRLATARRRSGNPSSVGLHGCLPAELAVTNL